MYSNCLISSIAHCSDSHGQLYKKKKAKQSKTHAHPTTTTFARGDPSFSLHLVCVIKFLCSSQLLSSHLPGYSPARCCVLHAVRSALHCCPLSQQEQTCSPSPPKHPFCWNSVFPLIGMQSKSFKISPKDVFKLVSNTISHCRARISASLHLFLFLGL